MFKPTAEHMEELLRAQEICASIEDELMDEEKYFTLYVQMGLARAYINRALSVFSDAIDQEKAST